MEQFDNKTGKIKKQESETKSLFKRSELNDWLPMWWKIVYFLTAFVGLTIIAYIVTLILFASGEIDLSGQITPFGMALYEFLVYLIAAIIYVIFIFADKRKTYKKIFSLFANKYTYLYALLVLGSLLFVNYFFGIIYHFVPIYETSGNQNSVENVMQGSKALSFFVMVIFAPFIEELGYRVGLCDTIGHKNRWLGIVLSALIFGAIHFDFTTVKNIMFESTSYWDSSLEQYVEYTAEQLSANHQAALNAFYVELLNFPIYFFSGFSLGFIYCWSGNIAATMIGHSALNLISYIEIIVASNATKGNVDIISRLINR